MTDPQPETIAQPPTQKPWQFNAETSRKAAHLAVLARREKAERIRNQPPPTPETVQPNPVDDFAGRRLMRVRDQLERLDLLAATEKDTKRLKELADATTRLSEQERVLSGRPLPGSRRPAPEGSARHARVGAWLVDAPPEVQVAPIAEVQPTAQPARPMGWEYDDPNAVAPVAPEPPLPGGVTP